MDCVVEAFREFLPLGASVLPVIEDRLCVDIFMNWVGYLLAVATFVYSVVCYALDFGVTLTPYNAVVLALSLTLLVWMRVGEWAMSDRRQFYGRVTETYVFMVGQWWLSVALFWAGLAGYCQIRRGQEVLEDNWFVLQTQVLIPFTTELDSKQNYELRATHLMALCIVTSLLCLPQAVDAWKALGGAMRMLRARFAVMLAEFVPLLVMGVATATYAVYAAEISAFATPDTTADLLWISAMAGLSIIAVALAGAALTAWGSCFASHALLALLLPLPAVVMFSTSLWVQARAALVADFVASNWDTIRLYVPPAYSALPWKNYAYASATPMLQAASLGLQLSMLCVLSAVYHLWAAAAMHSVGGALEDASSAHAAAHAQLLALALGEGFAGAGAGAGAEKAAGDAKGRGARAPGGGSAGSSSSSSSVGYGTSGATYAPLLPGAAAGAEAGSSEEAGGASSELFMAVDISRAAALKSRASAGEGASPEDRVLLARLDAVDSLRELPGKLAQTLNNLADRVSLPPLRESAELLRHDATQLWGSARTCIILCLGAGFCAVMGLTGALIKVTSDGVCSRLVAKAYGAVQYNFTASERLWTGGGGNYLDPVERYYPWNISSLDENTVPVPCFPPFSPSNPTGGRPVRVTVVHNYPLGSVEVLAAGGSPDCDKASTLSLEALYFAVSSGDLPSAGQLAAVVTRGTYISGPCGNDRSDCAGYDSVTITLSPPAKAEDKCLGVRLRLRLPSSYIQLNITAASAAVNVTGDLDAQLPLATPSLYSVNVATAAAPVTFTNVFADARAALPAALYFNNSILYAIPNASDLPGPGEEEDGNIRALRLRLYQGLGGIKTYVAPPIFSPSVYSASASGITTFNNVFAAGIYGASGGGVRFATAAGLCLYGGKTRVPFESPERGGGPTSCGSVEGHATGASTMGVSNLLLARSAAFSSERGLIVCANAAALIGTSLDFSSQRGNVYLSNLLQAAGNETTVSTSGAVSVSATFINRLVVNTRDSGKVGVVALFVGINSSSQLAFDIGGRKVDVPLLTLFNPQPADYSLPLVAVSTDFGDISALSVGGNPQSAGFANFVSVDFRSRDGAIKLEVNGGGINADYAVSSGSANAIVEINGNAAPLRGYLGKDGSGNNSVVLRSERDNVQLSLLPSPL